MRVHADEHSADADGLIAVEGDNRKARRLSVECFVLGGIDTERMPEHAAFAMIRLKQSAAVLADPRKRRDLVSHADEDRAELRGYMDDLAPLGLESLDGVIGLGYSEVPGHIAQGLRADGRGEGQG